MQATDQAKAIGITPQTACSPATNGECRWSRFRWRKNSPATLNIGARAPSVLSRSRFTLPTQRGGQATGGLLNGWNAANPKASFSDSVMKHSRPLCPGHRLDILPVKRLAHHRTGQCAWRHWPDWLAERHLSQCPWRIQRHDGRVCWDICQNRLSESDGFRGIRHIDQKWNGSPHSWANGFSCAPGESHLADGDSAYRFELFDLPNIPEADALLVVRQRATSTPPPKTHLEEKMLFALFWNRNLRDFWQRELGGKFMRLLEKVIPKRGSLIRPSSARGYSGSNQRTGVNLPICPRSPANPETLGFNDAPGVPAVWARGGSPARRMGRRRPRSHRPL